MQRKTLETISQLIDAYCSHLETGEVFDYVVMREKLSTNNYYLEAMIEKARHQYILAKGNMKYIQDQIYIKNRAEGKTAGDSERIARLETQEEETVTTEYEHQHRQYRGISDRVVDICNALAAKQKDQLQERIQSSRR